MDTGWDATRPDPATGPARYRIYNVGNQGAVNLMDYIKMLEAEIGRNAVLEFVEAQPGDVLDTQSDSSRLAEEFKFVSRTSLERGIKQFVDWYKSYYRVG